MSKNFGRALKYLIKENKISMKILGKAVGISQPHISRFANGKVQFPNPKMQLDIATYFKTTVSGMERLGLEIVEPLYIKTNNQKPAMLSTFNYAPDPIRFIINPKNGFFEKENCPKGFPVAEPFKKFHAGTFLANMEMGNTTGKLPTITDKINYMIKSKIKKIWYKVFAVFNDKPITYLCVLKQKEDKIQFSIYAIKEW